MPEATKGVLRSVFAGLGRILNRTEKPQADEAETAASATAPEAPDTAAPEAAAPEKPEPETAATEATAPEASASDTAEPEATEPEANAPTADAPEADASGKTVPEATPEAAESASEPAAPEAPPELPLPNYDELTIQSVRARLRNLSVPQLRQLIEHEKANAARADFITAFERRIAKVESGK